MIELHDFDADKSRTIVHIARITLAGQIGKIKLILCMNRYGWTGAARTLIITLFVQLTSKSAAGFTGSHGGGRGMTGLSIRLFLAEGRPRGLI